MSLRILVVDDDERVRTALIRSLRLMGLDVVAAEGGRAASRVLQQTAVHAVITDIWMPGEDGFHVVSEVERLQPGCPVIMISGLPREQEIERARALGVVAVLAKPFDLDELVRILTEHAGRSPG